MKWNLVQKHEDVIYEKSGNGIARITINRPEVRNAFRPQTLFELQKCFDDVREDPDTGVAILTGAGNEAFCAGGDQRIRGTQGYVGQDGVPRLNVLDLQKQIRSLPKPVVAMVAGYAIGGGHVLHVVCDLTIAADNARFGQTGPRVGSFDGGFGSSTLASIVGLKKAKEIWFLCLQYDAQQALRPRPVGTTRAHRVGALPPAAAALALLASLLIQLGTNFANDYSDFRHGADADRVGPTRVTQSGLVPPGTVKLAAWFAFGISGLFGIALAAMSGWPILVIGLASVAAGWLYTGGPWPLGYHGLGDLFVFVFFGLVATCGTVYAQALYVPSMAWMAGAAVGSLATAILVVNNLRDRKTDAHGARHP